jgi:hypothetical protein
MLPTIILYTFISIVIIFMGHSIFKYFTDLYTEEITQDLHTQTNSIVQDIVKDTHIESSLDQVSSREFPENNSKNEDTKNDELENYMNSLDEQTDKPDSNENLPDKLLEFNSGDMSGYADYNT